MTAVKLSLGLLSVLSGWHLGNVEKKEVAKRRMV